MVLTLFPLEEPEQYILNFFRVHRFGENKNLITTDHGAWVLLDDEEFKLLRTHKVERDPKLFSVLKEKGIIITKSNIEKVIELYRSRFHFLFYGPTLHIVVPTFRCNFKCVYCHSRAKDPTEKKWDMDEDIAKKIVDFILKFPARELIIEFQGGEPLLHFEAVKTIVEYARAREAEVKKKINFSLVTNMSVMTEEKLEFLKKMRVVGLSTSLDGPEYVHNKNRKYINGAGTYKNVVYWVRKIKEEYSQFFSLSALTTITKYSLNYPEEIAKEIYDLGFNTVWFRFLNNLGFAHDVWEKIGYTPEEFLAFYKKGLNFVIEELNKSRVFAENFGRIIAKKILETNDPVFVDLQAPCGAGIGQLLYDFKGDIFTCDEAKILGETFKLGNVRESSINDIYKSEKLKAMVDISSKFPLICDACPWFPYCGICPVGLFVSQGNIIPKLSGEFRCSIFKELIKLIFKKILFDEKARKVLISWTKMKIL
ncbi:MAG: His-Xaa-Ser system radical SAM maturase HxsB [Candidatus Aenigmarchaeota archaeon]|nr:His-Xaa-Ser system radical SAM maturase HxsB [Candidatus Aenigmarchaeota archaeon]